MLRCPFLEKFYYKFSDSKKIRIFGVSNVKDIMIVSFGDKSTHKIWDGEWVKGFSKDIQETTRRKLRMLNNSYDIKDLMIPPSNKLEKLKGNLKEFYSIRVNDQWRLIFKWENGNAFNVELIDYH